jgi:hypothetical protein
MMAVGAEHDVRRLDGFLTLRAFGIAGKPGIDNQSLPFRGLNAEGGMAQPCELDSFKIHEHTPVVMDELAF